MIVGVSVVGGVVGAFFLGVWIVVYMSQGLTAWAMMGRFGLTSFGHGAFLGIGAYVPALLWNVYGVTPWLGLSPATARRNAFGDPWP